MSAAGDVAIMLRGENKTLANYAFLGAELNEVQLNREKGLNARNVFCNTNAN